MTHLEIFKILSKDFCNKSSVNIDHREPVMTHNKVMAISDDAVLVVDKYVLPEEYYTSLKNFNKFNFCTNGMYKGSYKREELKDFLKDYPAVIDLVLKVFDTVQPYSCNCYTCTYQGKTRLKLLFTEYFYMII